MSDESKVLVCMGDGAIAGVPTVIIGIGEATWDYMEGGLTHTLDLTKLGIPAQVMIMRGKDHADIVAQLQGAADFVGGTFDDRRGKPLKDLGIDEPTKQ